jgi:hypothetical protein
MERIMERNKPIVIHIGFHKSGSTFIQNYFEKHPDVFFSRKILSDFVQNHTTKIPNFENEIMENFIFLSDMRLTVNSWNKTEIERIEDANFSEAEVRNIQLAIAKKLHSRFPSAKILITFREKSELLAPLYFQYLLNGGTKTYSKFSKDSFGVDVLFDYDFIEKIYTDIFGLENIKIISFNKLKENPQQFIQSICEMYNILFIVSDFSSVNASLSSHKQSKIRAINKIVFTLLWLFPKSQRDIIFKRYISWLIKRYQN